MALIEIKDISKHFGGLKAVDQVSISIEKGQIYGL
ncbi:MAG TPA: ABC transporter ATP-binding protein, partial [Deltaproteobacteria bacterium]|nr:ABC transporter ATP-binding protein [Deltaproteobacteria bacterium]